MDPPDQVWVQLGRLLPLGADDLGSRSKAGLRIESEVPGLLREWARREDGGWLALVTYPLCTADEQWSTHVTHYVPAHLIRRRGRQRGDRLTAKSRRTHG